MVHQLNSFNPKQFLGNIKEANSFQKNLDNQVNKIEQLANQTKSKLILIYKDPKREQIKIQERMDIINQLLEKWESELSKMQNLRNKMMDIWDVDLTQMSLSKS